LLKSKAYNDAKSSGHGSFQLEDILIHKFKTHLWSAQLVQTILLEEKDRNSLCTIDQHPPLLLLRVVVVAAVAAQLLLNIFEGIDEENVDEYEGSDFDA